MRNHFRGNHPGRSGRREAYPDKHPTSSLPLPPPRVLFYLKHRLPWMSPTHVFCAPCIVFLAPVSCFHVWVYFGPLDHTRVVGTHLLTHRSPPCPLANTAKLFEVHNTSSLPLGPAPDPPSATFFYPSTSSNLALRYEMMSFYSEYCVSELPPSP